MHRIQEVYFLLLPDTLLLDVAGPADALLFANRYQDEVRFEMRFISPQQSIDSSVGLRLGPMQPLPAKLDANAILVLPGLIGGNEVYTLPDAQVAITWLAQHFQAAHRLVCICSGALLAAHAGLLSGHRATTHHNHCLELTSIDSSIKVEENRIFVEDGRICTSAGVTAGIDLALHLINELAGPLTASAVARNLVVYMRRCGNDSQLSPWLKYRNHLHPAVHKMQDAMVKDPAHPWNLAELASIACSSSRHATRVFKLHTEVSIQAYLTSLRLSLASKFLANTDWSIERVAESSGFGSARQFRRIWNMHFPAPPSASQFR
ncbi:GlxA family transcriptional regulator [Undibacterium sp.]|uniref:GlxA family transcriptional regulator n=1 Tax=Undibacterium sp. TaxID=1914977 RepID=UPI0027306C2F|nr:helix-turn-helix domain-containing protein [Undibacterium sp.]MDP1978005.1 DJ-1/PfpI family protein [Undibacterium sp.]